MPPAPPSSSSPQPATKLRAPAHDFLAAGHQLRAPAHVFPAAAIELRAPVRDPASARPLRADKLRQSLGRGALHGVALRLPLSRIRPHLPQRQHLHPHRERSSASPRWRSSTSGVAWRSAGAACACPRCGSQTRRSRATSAQGRHQHSAPLLPSLSLSLSLCSASLCCVETQTDRERRQFCLPPHPPPKMRSVFA